LDALNTLTAKPLLDYLLAVSGMESPILTIDKAWNVFCRYLVIPDRDGNALASYQATVASPDESASALMVRSAREVTDDSPGFPLTRSAFLQFMIEGDCRGIEDQEVWTTDCADLEAFRSKVEGLTSFRYALNNPCSSGECMLDEMDANESEGEPGSN
jgi:hypothetical protein